MIKELDFDGLTFAGVAKEDNLDYFFSDDDVFDGVEQGVVIDVAAGEEKLDLLDDADVYGVIQNIEIPVQGATPELVAVPVAVSEGEYTPRAYPRVHARGRKSRRQLRKLIKKTSFYEVVHGKFGRPVDVK